MREVPLTQARRAGESEEALLAAHLRGDDRAFTLLFERHNERLYLYCARMLGDAARAEDVTQELWERIIRLRARPTRIERPLGFLLTIARNLCLNAIKREAAARRHAVENARTDAMETRSEMEEIVVDALAAVPMKLREVLILQVYSGYDFEEIGAMLGISTAAAWKRASRGREQLRVIVEKRVAAERIAADRRERPTSLE